MSLTDPAQTFRVDHLGLRLFVRHWSATTKPRNRSILIVHGLGEHSGRYAHVAKYFNAVGYEVYAYDRQGHGKSDGKRGTISSWAGFLSEINSVRADIEGRRSSVSLVSEESHQLYLWGQSLGGLSVLDYLTHDSAASSLAGAVVTSPLLRLAFDPSPIKVKAAKVAQYLTPNVTMSNELDTEFLARDAGVVSLYNVDPLNHDQISMRLGAALFERSEALLATPQDVPVPLLLMHGDADGINHVDGSREFARQAVGEPVTFRVWPGFYHELHNEPEQLEVLDFVRNWLDTQA